MAIHNGKFFDVEVTRAFFTDLADGYNEFNRNAKIHRGTLEDFVNTDAWQGKDAENAKKLMKANKITLLNEVLDLQAEATKLSEHILDKFRIEVDNAPDARIEYDTLWQINDDYKNLYFDYMDIHNDVESIASDSQLRFSRYGNIRIPESTNCEKAFAKLCGSDDDNAGFIYECIQKLIRFDSETEALINDVALGSKAEFLLSRMRTKGSAVNVGRLSSKSDFASGFDISDVRFGRRIVSARFNGRFLRNRFKDVIYIDDEQVPLRGGKRFSKSLRGMFTKSATKSRKTKSKAKTSTKATKQTQVQSVDYSVYETGVNAVDAYIPQVISDLESANNDELMRDYWATADENKRKAIAAVFNYDMAFIDGHLSNAKCEKQEIHVNSILKMMFNTPEDEYMEGYNGGDINSNAGNPYPSHTYYFNTSAMNELKKNCSNQKATKYLDLLISQKKNDSPMGFYDIDVKLAGAAVSFSIISPNGNIKDVLYQPKERIDWAIDYWERNGCYNYTYGFMSREEITSFYRQAKNSEDAKFIDKLMRTDGSYEEVFVVNPTKLSANSDVLLGQYGYRLAELACAEAEQGTTLANRNRYQKFLGQLTIDRSAGESWNLVKDNDYINRYAIGCGLFTDSLVASAWVSDPAYDNELAKQLEVAKFNERIAFALYQYAINDGKGSKGYEIGIDYKASKTENNTEEMNYIRLTPLYRVPLYGYDSSYVPQTNYDSSHSSTINGYTTTKGSQLEILLKHGYGLDAVGDLVGDDIHNLEKKKQEAAKNVAMDTMIDVVGIFCPIAGAGLQTLKDIANGNEAVLINAASSADKIVGIKELLGKNPEIVKGNKSFAKVLSAVMNYEKQIGKINADIDTLKDIESVLLFYNTSCYDGQSSGDSQGHYVKLDDLKMIRLIQQWNLDGISAVYDSKIYNYLEDNISTMVNKTKGNIDEDIEGDIEKAYNTIMYGVGYSGGETFDSILDIPDNIMRDCKDQINYYAGQLNGASLYSQVQSYR